MTKQQKTKFEAAFATIQEAIREKADEACRNHDPFTVHRLMQEFFAFESRKRRLALHHGLGLQPGEEMA